MALFGKKKANDNCCCGDVSSESTARAQAAQSEGAAVKILGSGCKKCNELEANTKAALEQLGMYADVDHVTDFNQIAAYGVMTTPALVVDGKVVSCGKVLKTNDVIKLLQKAHT